MKMLELDGEATLGSNSFKYALNVNAGEHFVVIGQNGAGKSALLRILAGLLPLEKGSLKIGGQYMDNPSQKIYVPPHKRPTVLQLQSGAVFPHLNVAENIAYPLKCLGVDSETIETKLLNSLERFALSEIEKRSPETLSGGELSRVALARSLISEPDVLLLDEPTSSIDLEASEWISEYLKELETTLILVSHDPIEALLIGNKIMVIDDGKIIQKGTTSDVASEPASSWVAKFLNLNLLSAKAVGLSAEMDSGGIFRLAEPCYGPVHITFSSSSISLYLDAPDGSPRNVWEVVIKTLHTDGSVVRVGIAGPFEATAIITQESLRHLDLRLGKKCWAAIKANELNVIPKKSLR
ncbi:MAG: hypothetical protein CL470_04575 [Acidimicrobiaceae bacterium]|nr:hypothetical protein [Acidimicrobiaceae bacterium]